MNELLINGIYNNCLETFLTGIDSNREELSVAYKKYLVEMYAETIDETDDINQTIAIFSSIEKKRWSSKSVNEKISMVVNDDALNRLREISSIAQKHAERKLGHLLHGSNYIPTLSEEEKDRYVKEMVELSSKVLPQNQNIATMLLSEGSIDFDYATNLTDDMSLRVSHLK